MNKKNSIENILKAIFKNRAVNTKKEQEEFLNPTNPEKITLEDVGINRKQVLKAIKRINSAIKNKEQIVVYGDYDVDGICSSAILWETLHSLGANVLPFIPSRFVEGYGLSRAGIESLKGQNPNVKLVITVDSGIVAYEGVEAAKEEGIDIIITDHHEPGENLPDALAVIHTTQISGSGVAWFFSRELVSDKKYEISDRKVKDDHLGLAALGTIADVLQLVRHNRSIAKFGLEILRKSTRVGIKALCEEATIKQEEVDTYHIGFMLAPRLNAAGRIENAMDSLRLLCTKDPKRARQLASNLGKTNLLRQQKTDFVIKHVESTNGTIWVGENLPKLLFVHHEEYEEGVIGIAAGRLVDQYHRPSIVVSKGEEFSKASARSIKGVNIIELIRKAGEGLLKNAGGHPMAAGFTVPNENLEAFALRLQQIAEKEIEDSLLVRQTRVDLEINFSDISLELYNALQKLSPFGYGNPEPVFKTGNLSVSDARTVGKEGQHLKVSLVQEDLQMEGIAFRLGELLPKLYDKEVEAIYSVDLNEWQGKKSLQLKVKNITF